MGRNYIRHSQIEQIKKQALINSNITFWKNKQRSEQIIPSKEKKAEKIT